MNNKEQKKDISNIKVDHREFQNDYKVLVQKLKSIKDTINLLEKYSLERDS